MVSFLCCIFYIYVDMFVFLFYVFGGFYFFVSFICYIYVRYFYNCIIYLQFYIVSLTFMDDLNTVCLLLIVHIC